MNMESSNTLKQLFSLEGKNAVVIGGAGYLGRAISEALAELGANLTIASRNLQECETFACELRENQEVVARADEIDIESVASIENFSARIDENYPEGIDVLVNCGWSGRKNTFESISDEDWNKDIEVCLNGVFRTIKRLAPQLAERKGTILNIGSMYGYVAPDWRLYDSEKFANPPSYGAAKAGIIQLTKYLASFLSTQGIRVNCLSPGPFPFSSVQAENPGFIERLCSKNPLGRIGKPHELKGAAALLCTDAGSYITGQNLCVDGGWGVW